LRRAVAVAALIGALLVCVPLLLRRPPPDVAARAPRRPPPRAESRAGEPGVELSSSDRNVFEYAEPRAPLTPRPPAPPAPPPANPEGLPSETVVDPVRLVGLVRRGGRPRAVLSIRGEVVVLAAGEESDGYRVVSVDEDAGVTVRRPDGSAQTFARPEAP
jgi:hypothetical protein